MVYIDPKLINVYKDEYLIQALYNPRIPKSLKIKIEYELYKRKSSNNKTTISTTTNYYKLEQLDNLYLCLGVAEFYVSSIPECYDH